MDRELEDQVIVREGDRKWMEELLNVLVASGIPAALNVDTQCRKGCCNDAYRLLVSSRDAENANERIEEHFMKVHPELRASNEMISQGKCPACGSPTDPDTVECPDCGLILIVVDQGNDQQAADGCQIKNRVFLPGQYPDPK
ncbi:MAG: hypothetical protein VST72_00885 [Nitrospirota bacterium]|nr:hypothetical protein [Nitrospirota bacterium]